MKCSIIIPTWRRGELLSATLDSLSRQTSSDFEVIVVSDGEDPQARALAKEYKPPYSLRWIFHPENRGQAAARNTGAFAAESEILVFLDDDTLPVPGWVYEHLQHHRTLNEGMNAVVFGRIVHEYFEAPRSHTERYMREIRDGALEEYEAAAAGARLEFGKMAAFGLNASLRRSVFLASGGFDPKLNYVDEDCELGTRIYERGIQFVPAPAAIVIHHDTKDIIEYHWDIARRAGRNDLYRRREKKQWNARIQLLAQMNGGSWWRRLVHRMAWHFPRLFRLAAALCRIVTDTTGSKLTFQLWCKLSAGEYWKGVRAAGETLDSLRQLGPVRTPILMFHSIFTPMERKLWSYYLSPGRFSRFMSWLKMAGYSTVPPEEWLAGNGSARSVILTFDDAYDDFYTNAFPQLERHGFKATVFVVVDRIGQTNVWDQAKGIPTRSLLSIEQIRDLQRRGVQFGSHTLTHPRLTSLSDKELEHEVSDSKRKLEDLLGLEVACIAYPWGDVDGRVRAAVAKAGYKIGMTVNDGLNYWGDPLCLKRANVSEVDNLFWLTLKLATGRDFRQRALERLVKWGLHPGWGESAEEIPNGINSLETETRKDHAEDTLPPAQRLEH